MPTVTIDRDDLFRKIGGPALEFGDKEFDELCFEFGIELDDIGTKESYGKVRAGDKTDANAVMYKIDIPANRYDLLCIEGLARAFRVFLELEPSPSYKVIEPADPKATSMTVKASTAQIRPFVVCAILRNLELDDASYNSLLDLQDHLHRNICRRRSLVAIGTHDLDSIQGPFTYEALPPNEIKFRHLFAENEMTGKEMLDWFRTDPAGSHISEYTGLIYDSPVYPVIFDANRTVLSLPPIINGFKSKISSKTKNIFIECTATDLTKAKIVLNTLIAMFSPYCADKNSVEMVHVHYEAGGAGMIGADGYSGATASAHEVYPNMSAYPMNAKVETIRSILGIQISEEEICKLCNRMMLGPCSISKEHNGVITVQVPPTRSDVLHEVDIVEDVGIAYGFNKLPQVVPPSHVPGKELPINHLSDLLRNSVAQAGYTEILTFGLCSHDEIFANVRRKDTGKEAVVLGNPKSSDFQVARSMLYPGLLRTLMEHRTLSFSQGVKLFEVSDVVLLDDATDTGTKNDRRFAAIYSGPRSEFEILHGLLDRTMQLLDIAPSVEYSPDGAAIAKKLRRPGRPDAANGEYSIIEDMELAPSDSSGTYFPGRGAKVLYRKLPTEEWKIVGTMGVLHPEVLKNFKISCPTSILEISLEHFVHHN